MIDVSFKANSPLEAIGILEAIQRHQQSTVEAPPPPPVLKSTVEAPPPPPVPRKFDIEKTKAKIGEELTRIVDSGNAARPYLTDKGYSGVDKIPESKLVAFLEMLKGEHVSG